MNAAAICLHVAGESQRPSHRPAAFGPWAGLAAAGGCCFFIHTFAGAARRRRRRRTRARALIAQSLMLMLRIGRDTPAMCVVELQYCTSSYDRTTSLLYLDFRTAGTARDLGCDARCEVPCLRPCCGNLPTTCTYVRTSTYE
jgi:hypothetical protein